MHACPRNPPYAGGVAFLLMQTSAVRGMVWRLICRLLMQTSAVRGMVWKLPITFGCPRNALKASNADFGCPRHGLKASKKYFSCPRNGYLKASNTNFGCPRNGLKASNADFGCRGMVWTLPIPISAGLCRFIFRNGTVWIAPVGLHFEIERNCISK